MGEESKSFKVNDRRRFDEEGNDRESSSEDKASTPHSPLLGSARVEGVKSDGQNATNLNETFSGEKYSAGKTQVTGESSNEQTHDFVMKETPANAGTGNQAGDQAGMLSFSSFLMSLATQALMQMGEMEPPGGIRLPPDFEAAKQTIEVIGMLAIKTKGNLDAEEQRLLAEVLHSVRLTFVQRVKQAMAQSATVGGLAGSKRPIHK